MAEPVALRSRVMLVTKVGSDRLRVTLDCGHQFYRTAKGPHPVESQVCEECMGLYRSRGEG